MKKLLYFSLFVLQFSLCSAQSWQWGFEEKTTDSLAGGEGVAIARDQSGNFYFTGDFDLSQIAGNDTLTCINHGVNAYLIKYDSNGNSLWGRQSVSSSPYLPQVAGKGVAVDKAGNIYMTGDFHDSVFFGANLISTNNHSGGMFLVKYDLNGNVLWVKQSVGIYMGGVEATAVATDGSDNVYVTGAFYDTAAFGPYTFAGNGGFLVKYDSSGNLQWARTIGNSGGTLPFSITADASGNTFVTGTFSDTLIAGRDTVVSSQGGFIAKYTTAGAGNWVVKGAHRGYSISLDNAENVYSTGYYLGNEVVGTDTLPGNGGWDNLYLDKYDSAGNFKWVKYTVNTEQSDCDGLSVCNDKMNNIYLCAGFGSNRTDTVDVNFGSQHFFLVGGGGYDPMAILKYDSSGNAICGSITSSGGDDPGAIVAEPSGYAVYFGGDFKNKVIFGPDTLKVSTAAGEVLGIAKWKPCSVIETSAEPIKSDKTITVYPNPSTGMFTFQTSVVRGQLSVEVYNVLGEKVYSQLTIDNPDSYQEQLTVDLSSLPNGIYFYRVVGDNNRIANGKLIINK